MRGKTADGQWISPLNPAEPYYNVMMKEASGWSTLRLVPRGLPLNTSRPPSKFISPCTSHWAAIRPSARTSPRCFGSRDRRKSWSPCTHRLDPVQRGWGQWSIPAAAELATQIRQLDPSRLVDARSGANCCGTKGDPHADDVIDVHDYQGPACRGLTPRAPPWMASTAA